VCFLICIYIYIYTHTLLFVCSTFSLVLLPRKEDKVMVEAEGELIPHEVGMYRGKGHGSCYFFYPIIAVFLYMSENGKLD
jgi:hypothetical protein